MTWLLATLAVLTLAWVALAFVLCWRRPEPGAIRAGLRILPDTVRLIPRLATDSRLPLPTRALLWLLALYLLSPIDLVPDFIPVIGFADDIVVTALVLRHIVRRAGSEVLTDQWPGTPEGLEVLRRALALQGSETA